MKTTKLELETEDFKIYSGDWKKVNGVKTHPKGDIWEKDGQQYFTFDSAEREIKKAGKQVPTKEEWKEIIESVTEVDEDGDFQENASGKLGLSLAGYRNWNNGQYYNQGMTAYYWSSTPTAAKSYSAYFVAGGGNVAGNNNRAYGFSVRCLKNLGEENTERTNIDDTPVYDPSDPLSLEKTEIEKVIEILEKEVLKKEVEARVMNGSIKLLKNIIR